MFGATPKVRLALDSGTEEDTYIVSGWAKANAVPSNGDSRKFKISVKITYTDNSTAWQESAVFIHSVSDRQFSSAAFTLSDGNASTQKTAKSITVCPRYQYQENYVYFDNLCLEKDNAQSYTYDSDGNLISVVDHSQQQSTMEYCNSDLIRNTDLKGYSYTYDYDADNALTTYNYNNATGTLTSYTDSTGNTTNYSYDLNTNSTTEISKTIDNDEYSVNYSYSDEGKYLETISHNNTDYNIEYDDIGNIHYGYVGRVLFSEETLLIAGGVVQILTGTSDESYCNSFFDDPRNQNMISYCSELWNQKH